MQANEKTAAFRGSNLTGVDRNGREQTPLTFVNYRCLCHGISEVLTNAETSDKTSSNEHAHINRASLKSTTDATHKTTDED